MEDPRLEALLDHFSYNPYVLREGYPSPISYADLLHIDDWNVRLILHPNPDPKFIPGTLEEAVGYIRSLKRSHIDYSGLIDSGVAVSAESLGEKNPYVVSDS